MAKIDKSKYTKSQWKKIRDDRRDKKKQLEIEATISKNKLLAEHNKKLGKKYTVLCLKHGVKYSSDYVNKLYNMVKRHCTLPFEMYCLTDDPRYIDPDIHILELPKSLEGWWCKPFMFASELPLEGTVLYMDLDVVLAGNIDKLFTYQPHHWCTIRDFTRVMRPKYNKYNSSIVRFNAGTMNWAWEDFSSAPKMHQRRYHGDQDWLFDAAQRNVPAMLFPDSWVQSWKWEVRSSREWAPGGMRGNRTFKTIETVTPRPECCVCVFHGDPNPENCQDPWVVDNWR